MIQATTTMDRDLPGQPILPHQRLVAEMQELRVQNAAIIQQNMQLINQMTAMTLRIATLEQQNQDPNRPGNQALVTANQQLQNDKTQLNEQVTLLTSQRDTSVQDSEGQRNSRLLESFEACYLFIVGKQDMRNRTILASATTLGSPALIIGGPYAMLGSCVGGALVGYKLSQWEIQQVVPLLSVRLTQIRTICKDLHLPWLPTKNLPPEGCKFFECYRNSSLLDHPQLKSFMADDPASLLRGPAPQGANSSVGAAASPSPARALSPDEPDQKTPAPEPAPGVQRGPQNSLSPAASVSSASSSPASPAPASQGPGPRSAYLQLEPEPSVAAAAAGGPAPSSPSAEVAVTVKSAPGSPNGVPSVLDLTGLNKPGPGLAVLAASGAVLKNGPAPAPARSWWRFWP